MLLIFVGAECEMETCVATGERPRRRVALIMGNSEIDRGVEEQGAEEASEVSAA
jgi:hypothetical protein